MGLLYGTWLDVRSMGYVKAHYYVWWVMNYVWWVMNQQYRERIMCENFNENEGVPLNPEQFKVTWLTGLLELEPIHHWVVRKKIKTWYGYKREYYIASEYGQLGIWRSYAEAYEMMLYMSRIANGV